MLLDNVHRLLEQFLIRRCEIDLIDLELDDIMLLSLLLTSEHIQASQHKNDSRHSDKIRPSDRGLQHQMLGLTARQVLYIHIRMDSGNLACYRTQGRFP